jgi:hypothetical protein
MLRCNWILGYLNLSPYSGVNYIRALTKVCAVTVVILLSRYIKTDNILYTKMKRKQQFSNLYYRFAFSVILSLVKSVL